MSENDDLKNKINKIVDLMIQDEAIKEHISELLKEIKEEYAIPATIARKVAVTVRKQNKSEEEQKYEEFMELVDMCYDK